MVALAMTGFVVGFALGLRFKVMVLLPMEVAALLAAALAAVFGALSGAEAVLAFAIFSVSAQISYAFALTLPVFRRQRAV